MSHYIGIDVSKARLDVDWMSESKTYANDLKAIKKLTGQLLKLRGKNILSLVVCEATGGYERKLVNACHQAKIPIHLAHANKVRYFAKSQGLLAKTDKIDAHVLSDYGRLLQPKADLVLLNKETEEMAELLKRREQLQADRKREGNRLDKITNKKIKHSIDDHIKWLDKNIKAIEDELHLLRKTEGISSDCDLLTSIPGVGNLTAYYLLASLPEIGKLSHKALAALVGVAPYNHDSGANQGKRFIQGGRSRLRQVLYMSAITTIRCNPDLKVFYCRLREKGKPVKVALIAVIRKLIAMASSVLKRGTIWQMDFQRT